MLSGILFCSNFIYAVLYGVLLILQYKFVELIYIYMGGCDDINLFKSIQNVTGGLVVIWAPFLAIVFFF